MSLDNVDSVITVRGREFPLPDPGWSGDATCRVMSFAILALYALEDPRVDAVLRGAKLSFVWKNGKEVKLFEDVV